MAPSTSAICRRSVSRRIGTTRGHPAEVTTTTPEGTLMGMMAINWRQPVLKLLKRAFLAASVAASGLISVAPYAAHAASPPSLTVVTPAAGSLTAGQLFTVTVNMNTNSTPITGWQFGLTYDPTIVELDNGAGAAIAVGNNLPNAFTYGNPSWLDTFPAPNGSAGPVSMKLTALGTVQFGGQALSGQNPGTGSTGASPPALATFQFKGLANGTSPFTLTSPKIT